MEYDSFKGLGGVYVDDLIQTGDKWFEEKLIRTRETFNMAEDEHPPCNFTGFRLYVGINGFFEKDQNYYLKNLEYLILCASFSELLSVRMILSWLPHTPTDCLLEISKLS